MCEIKFDLFDNNSSIININSSSSEKLTTTTSKDIVIPLQCSSNHSISIFENDQLIRTFQIENDYNDDINIQFLHLTIKKLPNDLVLLEGILSNHSDHHGKPFQDANCQGLKFQPFYLSNKNDKNLEWIGKGLFKRGIHSTGWETPTNIKSVCSCDGCGSSFTLNHFNSSQSQVDYFYSNCGKRTLVVAAQSLGRSVEEIDQKLKESGWEDFSYLNPLKCPHCLTNFIDFEGKKVLKDQEIYGNYHSKIEYWKKLK